MAIGMGGMLMAFSQAWADDHGTFSITSGIDYSSGKYGNQSSTDITSVPFIGKYEIDRLTLKLTVPYITVTGLGNVAPGIGKFKDTPNARRTTESGIGDVVTAATYNLFGGNGSVPMIDLTGKIKFGTADRDKGLGTGENDYSAQVDLYQTFGKFTALGTIGYRVYGDTSTSPLDNVFFGSVGGTYKLTEETNTGIVYDYRPAITINGSEVSEITAFVNQKIDDHWKAQGYLVKGFADGSPDYGIGGLVTYVF